MKLAYKVDCSLRRYVQLNCDFKKTVMPRTSEVKNHVVTEKELRMFAMVRKRNYVQPNGVFFALSKERLGHLLTAHRESTNRYYVTIEY